jgi:uncharacterized protein
LSASVDANILVYASNDSDPLWAPAQALIRRLADGPELVYLFWPTTLAYMRIVTHPSILPKPLTPNEAATNVERLLSRPHVRAIGEAAAFWRAYLDCGGSKARGNAVPDTHLAALMRENGVRILYTRDRNFRRFDFLDVRDPFSQPIEEGKS